MIHRKFIVNEFESNISAQRLARTNVDSAREDGREHEVVAPDFHFAGERAGNLRHRDHAAADQGRLDYRNPGSRRRLHARVRLGRRRNRIGRRTQKTARPGS